MCVCVCVCMCVCVCVCVLVCCVCVYICIPPLSNPTQFPSSTGMETPLSFALPRLQHMPMVNHIGIHTKII